jgi:hypothetical protein
LNLKMTSGTGTMMMRRTTHGRLHDLLGGLFCMRLVWWQIQDGHMGLNHGACAVVAVL